MFLLCQNLIHYVIVNIFQFVIVMKWLWKSLKQSEVLDYNLTVDKFWQAVNVWNTKPHLLIKHLIGAEQLFDITLSDDIEDILSILSDQPITWYESPEDTLNELKLNEGHDIQVEVWKLLTKKPVDWNDYLRLSVFCKCSFQKCTALICIMFHFYFR